MKISKYGERNSGEEEEEEKQWGGRKTRNMKINNN